MRRTTAIFFCLFCVMALTDPGWASETIRMPTARDAQTILANLEGFLNRRVERVLPGPVTDQEVVVVRSDPSGEPLTVRVDQRLMLRGLGDYFFRIPGPATRVEALPDSESSPGIRKGSILWQGFSPRHKLLAARALLVPEQEKARLPFKVTFEATVGGELFKADGSQSGAVRARIVIENVTTIPINLATAEVGRAPLAGALDAAFSALKRGERPIPGESGVPKLLVSAKKPDFALDQIQTAFDIDLSLKWPNVDDLRSTFGRVHGDEIRDEGIAIGGGGRSRIVLNVEGEARNADLPMLEVTGTPDAPPASTVRPPSGARSWAAVPEAQVSNDRMFRLLMQTMWRTALLVNYDAYLGNPDAKGASSTVYRYVLATPQELVTAPAPEVPKADPLTVGLAWVGLVLLIAAAVGAWSLS